jgi:hypothetical protein
MEIQEKKKKKTENMSKSEGSSSLHILNNKQFPPDVFIILVNPKKWSCYETSELTDSQIIVQYGKTFKPDENVMEAHSVVLSIWSAVLKLQYSSDRFGMKYIKGYDIPNGAETFIDKKTVASFFKSFYYLPDCDPVSKEGYNLENILDIIRLSKLYDIPTIESICRNALVNMGGHTLGLDVDLKILNGICEILNSNDINTEQVHEKWCHYISTIFYRIVKELRKIEIRLTQEQLSSSDDDDRVICVSNNTKEELQQGITMNFLRSSKTSDSFQVDDSNETIDCYKSPEKKSRPFKRLAFGNESPFKDSYNITPPHAPNKVIAKKRLYQPDFSSIAIVIGSFWFYNEKFIEMVNQLTLKSIVWLNTLVSLQDTSTIDENWIRIKNKRMFIFMIHLRILLNHAIITSEETKTELFLFPYKKEFIDVILTIPTIGKPNLDMKFLVDYFNTIRTRYAQFYTTNAEILCILNEKIMECTLNRLSSN